MKASAGIAGDPPGVSPTFIESRLQMRHDAGRAIFARRARYRGGRGIGRVAWRGDCAGSRTCFLSAADVYTADQVTLFGEVMGRLADNADRLSLAELSGRLAPVARAPLNVLHSLARHGDIAVWGPVLEQAAALPDEDLVEIADKDPADPNKLMKIAARPQLGAAVTDVLFKRGDRAIQRTIIAGRARIGIRLRQADHEPQWDKDLAAAIAARDDVPAELRPWLSKILD